MLFPAGLGLAAERPDLRTGCPAASPSGMRFGVRSVEPNPDSMEAGEVLAWLAFGKAISWYEWSRKLFNFRRSWPVLTGQWFGIPRDEIDAHFGAAYDWHDLTSALSAAKAGKSWHRAIPYPPERAAAAEAQLERLLSKAPAGDLLAELRADSDALRPMVGLVTRAQANLRRSLQAGLLRSDGIVPNDWHGRSRRRTMIPSSDWKIGTRVLPDGTAYERLCGCVWTELLFDTQEVLALWPPGREVVIPVMQDNGPGDVNAEPIETGGAALALAWVKGLACGASHGAMKPKRDPALHDCMAATKCTYREALAAWNACPGEWRNPPRRAVDAAERPPAARLPAPSAR